MAYEVCFRCLASTGLFHQVKIVQKYLTCRPELPTSRELLEMVHTDKENFVGAFEEWSERWPNFLKERSRDPSTGKSHYTHRKLRSAKCVSEHQAKYALLVLCTEYKYLWRW